MNSPLRSLAQGSLAQKNVQPLRLVIVEDDLVHYRILKRIVSTQFPHLSIVGHCESVQELKTHIAAEKPDILLIDIQVRGGTAFEALKDFSECCFDTIVLSAQHDFHYAQEAIRLGASDYIPKPYNAEDVIAALEKVIAKRTSVTQAAAELSLLKQQLHDKADNSAPASNADEILCLRDGQEDIAVPVASVCYVEADNHHVILHTIEGKYYRYRAKFCEFIQRMAEHGFLQTHKSYAVSGKHIEKLVPEFAVLRWEGKHEKKVPIARRYAPEVKRAWQTFRVH